MVADHGDISNVIQARNLILQLHELPEELSRLLQGVFFPSAQETLSLEFAIEKLTREVRRQWIDGTLSGTLPRGLLAQTAFKDLTPPGEGLDDIGPPALMVEPLEEIVVASGNSLLVLGDAGAGKTTALLHFLRSLVDAAAQDTPVNVPIVLPLRDWRTGSDKNFHQWAVAQLVRRYKIGTNAAEAILDDNRRFLVLDGLDEAGDITACADAIASMLRAQDTDCVVTCRSIEYRAAGLQLPLRRIIELQPLDPVAVLGYVNELGPEYQTLLKALVTNRILMHLCCSPLMLRIAVKTYKLALASSATNVEPIDEDRLLHRYFADALEVPTGVGSRADAFAYLANLAAVASPNGRNEIDLDSIREQWPERRGERDYDYEHERKRTLKEIKKAGPWAGHKRLAVRVYVVEGFARVSTMWLVAALLFRVCVYVLDKTGHGNLVPTLTDWRFQLLIYIVPSLSINSKSGRGWKIGQGFPKYARDALVPAVFLGLFFGLINGIVWNCVWLVPLLVIVGGISTFWSLWHERTEHIARAIRDYTNLGNSIEDRPDEVVFISKRTSTWKLKKPRLGLREFWGLAVGVMILIAALFGFWRLVGRHVGFSASIGGYLGDALGIWIILLGGFWATSVVYFFATRFAKVLPWRIDEFVRVMVSECLLQKDGEKFRVWHDVVYRYLTNKARLHVWLG